MDFRFFSPVETMDDGLLCKYNLTMGFITFV